MMEIMTCKICGLTYAAPDDNREHARRHQKFLTLSKRYAVPRFGQFLWAYAEREENKREGSDHEHRLYAWFCRSVTACGKFTHPDFSAYSAMMKKGGPLHARGASYWNPEKDSGSASW